MKNHILSFAVAALGLFAATTASADTVRTEREVRARLAAAGYAGATGIELDGGVWQAVAIDARGRDVEVRVDPASGRVYAITRERLPMSETELRMALRDDGYTRIRDVDYDASDRVWHVEAQDPVGDDVELEIDASSGLIVSVEED